MRRTKISKLPAVHRVVDRFYAFRERVIGERASRRRSRLDAPKFVGVTGSSTKSTTVALLTHILAGVGTVVGQHGANTLKPLTRTILRVSPKTDFVVAECAAGKVGSIRDMAAMLRPHMAIVTLVAMEHKSTFRTVEAIAAEKCQLVAGLGKDGVALLNADDPLVAGMAARTSGRVVTFGRKAPANYRVVDTHATFPERLSLTVSGPGGELPLRTRFLGEHFWLPVAAAAVAALELGVAPEIVAARVATFAPLTNRGEGIETEAGASVILDTVKAPWHSVPLAFDILQGAVATRRRIFLGHMSDFSGSSEKYRQAYGMARKVADEVVFIGNHHHRSKASQDDIDSGRFKGFATPREAADYLRDSLIPGEVILIKGSIDLHLERLGLQLREEVGCWVTACGKRHDCLSCRRFGHSYEDHKGAARFRREFEKMLRDLGKKPAR